MTCSRLGDIAYRCTDEDLDEGDAGRNEYVIIAHRRAVAGGKRCATATGKCLTSERSVARTVTIPAPGEEPSPREEPTDASTHGATNEPTQSPTAQLGGPFSSPSPVAFPPGTLTTGTGEDRNPVVVAVAAALLTAVVLQVLRRRSVRISGRT